MTETTTTEEQPTAPQQSVSLSLNDLKVCLQIIDLCSQRGAFKPDEFQAVGALHQKLTVFLSQSVPAATELKEEL
tara:strand:- start:1245 stop:1469 length:225 start_codon:yes stop_codon:yes gene_type:complete